MAAAGPLQHHLIDLRAVRFIQRHKAGDGAVTAVSAAERFDELRDIRRLRPELREGFWHADREIPYKRRIRSVA